MGQVLEDKDGFVQFLVNKEDGIILGCHIIRSYSSIPIHEVLVVIRNGNGNNGGCHRCHVTKNLHIHTAFSEVGARAAASPVYTSQR